MIEKFKNDIISAMKAKDKVKLATLRSVKSGMQIEIIGNKTEENDDLFLSVVNKQIKLRNDSIAEFKKANREDLVNSYQQEIDILKEYMPKELTSSEVNKIINDAIEKLGITSIKEMGRIMKEITPIIKNRCDMSSISAIIKEKLSNL